MSIGRFPTDISVGSAGGPNFNTKTIVLKSGHEKRIRNWDTPRYSYDISYAVKTHRQLKTLVSFFVACRGRAESFRFKDWNDFTVTDQVLPTDGVSQTIQLIKTYGTTQFTQRRITKPVTATFKLNGVDYTDFTIDNETGIITHTGTVPLNTDILTWSGEFDVHCRFDTDELTYTLDNFNTGGLDVPIIEVLE